MRPQRDNLDWVLLADKFDHGLSLELEEAGSE